MSGQLPAEFADLEPWTDWALTTMAERSARRSASSMQQLEAFYAAMLPRLEAVLEYLGRIPTDDVAPENRRLLDLSKSLAEVAPAVELFAEPTISYGYDVARFAADPE
ncbi:MAG: hypothetical protein OES38_21265 [Gammaproteobacteria bacterium]|nr:hypothetical protein [Gammaproteobacteria bacterium]